MKKTVFAFALFSLVVLTGSALSAQEQQPINRWLIVLDVQQCYTQTLDKEEVNYFITEVNKTILGFKPEHIVYIRTFPRVLSVSFSGISVDTLDGVGHDERLLLVEGHHLFKTEGNDFATPEILRFFNENKADEIVVTGLLAEKCVKHTVLGGLSEGFSMIVQSKAVIGKTPSQKEKALNKCVAKGAIQE